MMPGRRSALLASGAEPAPQTIERIAKGWIAEEALAISVYAALAFPGDFRRGVLLAVNHGGDGDSTGAIAGNIPGVLLGQEAIPGERLDHRELREESATLAGDRQTRYRDDREWRRRYPDC